MNRLDRTINWVALVSEVSHFFCCGLPMIFSILSLSASLGLTAGMPTVFYDLHEVMHGYEKPLIIMSSLIILMGWGLHFIALKLDCRDTGCAHGPCKPKKKRSAKILMIATAFFCFNVTGYFLLHN